MSHDEADPGRHLLIHQAPEDLLDRALSRPAPSPAWLRPVMAAAFFLLGVVAGQLSMPQPPPAAPLAAADEGETRVPVKLVLYAPDARSVTVAGSWNAWGEVTTPMQRAEDGTFFTVLHLPRGRHEYMFVLDDEEWVTDPTALLTRDDGFGRQNALIEI